MNLTARPKIPVYFVRKISCRLGTGSHIITRLKQISLRIGVKLLS